MTKLIDRLGWAVPLILLVVVLVLPWLGFSALSQRELILIGVYCLVTAGINLSFGYGGELALGQVAIMAAGAYTALFLGSQGVTDIVVQILVAAVVGALLGLITGLPGLRLSKWSLGLTSFFLIMLLPGVVVALREFTGGLEGRLVPPGTIFGQQIDIDMLYIITFGVVGVWFFFFRGLIISNYGTALRSFRTNPMLAESLGVSGRSMRLSSYVIGAVPAAVAGVLYALLAGYLSPSPFNLALLLAVLAASIFGGSDSIYGPLIGAVVLIVGPTQIEAFEEYSLLIYGVFLLLVGGLFRHGIAGYFRRILVAVRERESARTNGPPEDTATEDPIPHLKGGRLEATAIVKEFGGVRALDGASLIACPGEVTAIIGGNGAGKTTMLNAISGFLALDAGAVEVDGQRISGQSAAKIARKGISRAFQTPAIPEEMTVLEVVSSGSLRSSRLVNIASLLRLPSFHRARKQSDAQAMALLRLANLEPYAAKQATAIPLGLRRLIEVLRAAMGSPQVIMLDEPAAGLDESALADLGRLLEVLKEHGATVVLIEHNVPFVMSVADVVFAMDTGKVIAQGDPESVRNSPEVIRSYLGRPPTTSTIDVTEEVR